MPSRTPKKENKKKIYRALRSLFRYSKFKEASAPEVLLTCEKKILEQSLSDLEPDDFYYVVQNWADFYIEQIKELEVDDALLLQEIDRTEDVNKHLN